MNRRAFYHLLQRYAEGNCTDEERKLVEQWYELLDDDHEPAISTDEVRMTVDRLWPVIKEKTLPAPVVRQDRKVRKIAPYVGWAAAAAVLAGIAWGAWWFTGRKADAAPQEALFIAGHTRAIMNEGQLPDTVLLPDKSVVILEPNARLYYPDSFAQSRREVYLEGDAFFKVIKNPSLPFYVYSHNIVTRVLGTSFFVKAGKDTRDVEVSVCTGKVAVYENAVRAAERIPQGGSPGVILRPNQKVVYNRQDGHFRTSLVDMPLPLAPNKLQEEMVTELNFVFEETPLSRVLSLLESAYHIEIITANDQLGKCLFTGDIKGQNLYDQLEIICQSVQASYEVRGTQILIKSDPEH